MERKTYTLKGVTDKFIFDINRTTASSITTDKEYWEVEVICLPHIPFIPALHRKFDDLMIRVKENGACILSSGKFLEGKRPEFLDQYLINYCEAYAQHLQMGTPVSTFF